MDVFIGYCSNRLTWIFKLSDIQDALKHVFPFAWPSKIQSLEHTLA